MFNDFTTLKSNDINVFTVKSDALTIRKQDLDKAISLIHFSSDIGGWRLAKTEDIKFPHDDFKQARNVEIKVEVPSFERVEIKDEYDTNELCDVLENYESHG